MEKIKGSMATEKEQTQEQRNEDLEWFIAYIKKLRQENEAEKQ